MNIFQLIYFDLNIFLILQYRSLDLLYLKLVIIVVYGDQILIDYLTSTIAPFFITILEPKLLPAFNAKTGSLFTIKLDK